MKKHFLFFIVFTLILKLVFRSLYLKALYHWVDGLENTK